MSENQLKLNPDKTHKPTVGTQQRINRPENTVKVLMQGFAIEESEQKHETVLGIDVQNNLKWDVYISKLRGKLKKRIAGIYKLRNLVPFNTLSIICQGWFKSVLVYCLPLFGGCGEGNIDDLQVIQNKLARLVTFSEPREHRDTMYNTLQWMTIRQLICYHTLVTIFRIRIHKEPEHFATKLLDENRNGRIIIPHSNLTVYRKSFLYRGILVWNSLPEDIRCQQEMSKFKIDAKEWILQNVNRFH